MQIKLNGELSEKILKYIANGVLEEKTVDEVVNSVVGEAVKQWDAGVRRTYEEAAGTLANEVSFRWDDPSDTQHGANFINVIKVVREVTGLGLKEAKDICDAAKVSRQTIRLSEPRPEGSRTPADIAQQLRSYGANAYTGGGNIFKLADIQHKFNELLKL